MARTLEKAIFGILMVFVLCTGSVLITMATNTNPVVEDTGLSEAKDIPITGSALDRASVAALDHIGEGQVTDTEVGDEEGYYEIEITLNNGNEVDVHLDKNFRVLSTEYEDEEEDD